MADGHARGRAGARGRRRARAQPDSATKTRGSASAGPRSCRRSTPAVQAQLDAARHLRLLRDQWTIRQALYRDYSRAVGTQLLQLVKAQPALEAIRRLEGPSPGALVTLRGTVERRRRAAVASAGPRRSQGRPRPADRRLALCRKRRQRPLRRRPVGRGRPPPGRRRRPPPAR